MFDLFGIKARKTNAYLMRELIKCKDVMTDSRRYIIELHNENNRLRNENQMLSVKLQSMSYDIDFPNSNLKEN